MNDSLPPSGCTGGLPKGDGHRRTASIRHSTELISLLLIQWTTRATEISVSIVIYTVMICVPYRM